MLRTPVPLIGALDSREKVEPMNLKIVSGVLAAAMILALAPAMPYGYYSVMRWIVSGLCVWLAALSYRESRELWTWAWGILAGIYNPIVPIHSTREIWSIVNLATLVAVALHYKAISKTTNQGDIR